MKFKIVGTLKESNDDIDVVISASSYRNAESQANAMGISVTDIFPEESASHQPAPSTHNQTATLYDEKPKPIDITATMWLSVPTLGIYGIIVFYRVMNTYLRYSSGNNTASSENLVLWFWLYIGFAVAGGLLFPFGIPLTITAIVFGAILLNKVIHKRNVANERLGGENALQNKRVFKNSEWHLWMWVLGSVFSIFILPFILIILQGIQFFKEYNAFVSAIDEQ
jgi:hypothetical protein